jgi:hypothetical protein
MRKITNRHSTALTVNQGYKWHFATHQVTNRQKKHSKMGKNGDDGHPTRSAVLGFGHCAAVCVISSLSVLFCAEMASFLGSQGRSLSAIKVGLIGLTSSVYHINVRMQPSAASVSLSSTVTHAQR